MTEEVINNANDLFEEGEVIEAESEELSQKEMLNKLFMMVKESKDAVVTPKKKARSKRVLSETQREKCLENLRKGRETVKRNKEAKRKEKEQDNIKKVVIKEPEKRPPTPPIKSPIKSPVKEPTPPPPSPSVIKEEVQEHIPKVIEEFKSPIEEPAPRRYYGFTF